MTVVSTGELTLIDVMDGLNARLSLNNFVVSTETDGSGGDYSGATTSISVFQGTVDDSANWTYSALPSLGVTGTLTGQSYAVTGMAGDAGFVDIIASRVGFPSISARFTVVKAKRGIAGGGATLWANKSAFNFTDGNPDPAEQVITISLQRNGLSNPVFWFASNGYPLETDKGAIDIQSYAFGLPGAGVGDTCYVPLAAIGGEKTMYVTAVCGDMTLVHQIVRNEKSTAEPGATRNVFRGTWGSGTIYSTGDIVILDGTSYSAVVPHIASALNTPPNGSFWAPYAAKGDRGTAQVAMGIAGTTWTVGDAQAALLAGGFGAPQRGDVVTLYNSASGFSQTRVFTTEGAWVALAAFFGGDVLVDGSVVGNKIAANTITANNIAANTIVAGSAIIEDGAIETAKIKDGAITNAKIANLSVQSAKIADGAITSAKIGNLEVTSAKIANLTVGTEKITGNAVSIARSAGAWSDPAINLISTWTTVAWFGFVPANENGFILITVSGDTRARINAGAGSGTEVQCLMRVLWRGGVLFERSGAKVIKTGGTVVAVQEVDVVGAITYAGVGYGEAILQINSTYPYPGSGYNVGCSLVLAGMEFKR